MPKLTKSQMIIFSVLTLTILYFIYDQFLAKTDIKTVNEGQTAKKPDEVKALVSGLAVRISKETVPDRYYHLIRLAEKKWPMNPFFGRKEYSHWILTRAMDAELSKISIKYTGYLDFGIKKMAIINGVEYAVGEPLEIEGYILRGIHPHKVTLEHRINRIRFDVPLQDN